MRSEPGELWSTATSEIQNQIVDYTRWNRFAYRGDDIVIATFGKTGTTWVQQIVGQLIFRGASDIAIGALSPWIEYRGEPIEEVTQRLQLQAHRRFVKTHLPAHAVRFNDSASYIYVARDARDQMWSAHHHLKNLKPTSLVMAERERHDRCAAPQVPEVREYYHYQLDRAGSDPWPYWRHVLSWWNLRARPNVMLVHFANLKADLQQEIRKLAGFLGIDVPDELWPSIIDHVQFDYMKRNADQFSSAGSRQLIGGAATLLNRGVNGRWQEVLTSEEVAKCDEVACRYLPIECAAWLRTGHV